MKRFIMAFTSACVAATLAAAQAPTPAPPTCAAPEYRAFDFWLGEWDVYVTGTENLAGRSSIVSEDTGCVITEHYRSTRAPYTGRSVNIYDRATGHWNQVWVDSTGEITRFVGGPHNGGMRLTDPANVVAGQPGTTHTRMTFSVNADGSVRQLGETSPDGVTWTARYDFTYRRRAQ